MEAESEQQVSAADGARAGDPSALERGDEASNSLGTYASKIPPDHPGLRLERPKGRALRRGPALVALGILIAAVSIAVVVAFSPRSEDARAASASVSEPGGKQVQISEAVEKVPGNDAPLRQVPKLGPPRGARGETGVGVPAENGATGDRGARRQAVREETQKALASPILFELENPALRDGPGFPPVAASGTAGGGGASSLAQASTGAGTTDPNLQQHKSDFLARDGASPAAYLSETPKAPRSPYEVKAGTIIPTTLITGIDSDLPGQIVGQVRENVYDTVTGRYLLIQQGSRLLATYDSMIGFGQERVLVCWNRLIRPDGVSIGLECMPGVDLAGYAGFADDVDHHWWRILSGVALGTLLSATAQRSQGDVSGFQPTFPQLWASNAAGTINAAGQQLTQKNLQIQPTIKVRPGFTVNVLVSKDIMIAPAP